MRPRRRTEPSRGSRCARRPFARRRPCPGPDPVEETPKRSSRRREASPEVPRAPKPGCHRQSNHLPDHVDSPGTKLSDRDRQIEACQLDRSLQFCVSLRRPISARHPALGFLTENFGPIHRYNPFNWASWCCGPAGLGFVWRIFAFAIGFARCDCTFAVGFVWRRRGSAFGCSAEVMIKVSFVWSVAIAADSSAATAVANPELSPARRVSRAAPGSGSKLSRTSSHTAATVRLARCRQTPGGRPRAP